MTETHPKYNIARKKLRDIRRLIRGKSINQNDVATFTRLWNVALEKDPSGVQCVYFIEDLIEMNQSLRW